MKKAVQELSPRFVGLVPKELEDGIFYVSVEYATTAHKCACGCGHKVVLPLHPTDWRLTFDGKSITMWPSVGNWGFPCRSHYLIAENRIEWAADWTDAQIAAGRARDVSRRTSWHGKPQSGSQPPAVDSGATRGREGWLRKLFKLISGS